jgi:diaminopimelate decarboxylase
MTGQYEPPTIIRHGSGLANKFGRAQKRTSMPEIDGVPVKELIQEFGSPLFVFSERTIRETYRSARRAFELRYPKVQCAWSYKTNYLDAVCSVFHDEGAWAEVVSEHEYAMARRLGVPGSRIIFNGPYKPEWALEEAARDGARIHLDHFDELYALERVAARLGRVIPVGLRINLDAGITPAWNRFGFKLENGEAWEAARRIQGGAGLRLTGLHTHIGTFILEPQAYAAAGRKLADLACRAQVKLGASLEYLDLGGGFASRNTLHGQYAPGDEANPSFDAYAEAISDALLGSGLDPAGLPTLVLESGRSLIDEAGYLITSVVGVKRLPNDCKSLVVDAGVNLLFTAFWYKHDILPARDHHGTLEEVVIYGPLCMNIDVLRHSVYLPVMEPGDLLVVPKVGAYNVTQWMQFIRMRPAVVMIGRHGGVETIRRPETVAGLKALEAIPTWMRHDEKTAPGMAIVAR